MESNIANAEQLANLFDIADKDKSGVIKLDEVQSVFNNKGFPVQDIEV